MLESTQARRRALLQAARRLQVDTSEIRKLRFGPRYWTQSLRLVVRTDCVVRANVFKTHEEGVVGGA
jgi:hypothetical protein